MNIGRLLRLLAVLLSIPVAFALGLWLDEARELARGDEASERRRPSRGRWNAASPAPAVETPAPEDGEGLDPQLAVLPYLAGYEPPTGAEGVTVRVPGLAEDGYNFVLSGHGAEALLLDMDGEKVHDWRLPPYDSWREHRKPDDVGLPQFEVDLWRAARLLPGGDLLVIYEGLGVARLDRDSNLRWARWAEAHHAIHVLDDGRFWLLERAMRPAGKPVGPRRIIDDQLTLLDADGNLLRRISLGDAFASSPWSPLTLSLSLQQNPYHSNSIRRLPGGHELPAFAAGHLLISMRGLNALAVVDPEKERVVWALAGRFERQHDAQLLENGNLLVLDNRPSEPVSRVVELDPVTLEVAWEFAQGFHTAAMGGAQRLAGGNTLVIESMNGRAFEVTPAGEVVWEWVSPFRVEAESGRELVATLFDLRRHPRDRVEAWLAR